MFGAEALSYDELDLDPGIRARFLTPDAALVDYLEIARDAPDLQAADRLGRARGGRDRGARA